MHDSWPINCLGRTLDAACREKFFETGKNGTQLSYLLALVPEMWLFQMNLIGLGRISEVIILPKRLPSLRRHYGNPIAPLRRVRNMRVAVLIGFHIHLNLLVFLQFVLLDVADVDAGAFYRLILLSAGYHDAQPVCRSRFPRLLFPGFRLLRLE